MASLYFEALSCEVARCSERKNFLGSLFHGFVANPPRSFSLSAREIAS